eukprot:GHVQ01010533.1.p1 GENE.GHVQ01010533.1~~GHVQ01010533.1.p1  ORF type:complete len:181 (+),score=18.73 GHVQ01010533.1:362-904(+)
MRLRTLPLLLYSCHVSYAVGMTPGEPSESSYSFTLAVPPKNGKDNSSICNKTTCCAPSHRTLHLVALLFAFSIVPAYISSDSLWVLPPLFIIVSVFHCLGLIIDRRPTCCRGDKKDGLPAVDELRNDRQSVYASLLASVCCFILPMIIASRDLLLNSEGSSYPVNSTAASYTTEASLQAL